MIFEYTHLGLVGRSKAKVLAGKLNRSHVCEERLQIGLVDDAEKTHEEKDEEELKNRHYFPKLSRVNDRDLVRRFFVVGRGHVGRGQTVVFAGGIDVNVHADIARELTDD